uniref:Signal transducing adapter molecule 1-like n=1 Tax=Phallusia mammillata TaxID=59560 RepID=A0A6F9DUE3_9ASCI|nr:signal transducing adapter molecule 1-like [Phallusia mammillata]
MGIFSNSTPFDEPLEKATNEMNTETDWGLIVSICDKVKTLPKGSHEFAGVIIQKINHRVPHVSMQALTVLDSCVNNCGKDFRKEVASQGFTDCLRDTLFQYKNKTVTRKLRFLIRKWAEDFKEDPELSHFVSFYYSLRGDGMEFPEDDDTDPSKSKRKEPVSTDPNSVSSQQEADDIAKAIEASLKEEQQKKGYLSNQPQATSSLYPSVLGNASSTSFSGTASYTSSSMNTPKKRVKALYDFEAAEDNELTFKAGDFLSILDDSDPNWWKGEGSNGSGLFPSNFVTADLSAAVEDEVVTSNGVAEDTEEEEEEKDTVVKFNDNPETKEFDKDQPVLEVNEDLIDETLAVLQSTDPETTTTDSPQLLRNEDSCNQMGKLIDTKLEAIDRKHLELTLLNEKILDSLKLYDSLMKQMPVYPAAQQYMPGQMPPVAGMHGQPGPAMMAGYQPGPYQVGNNAYMPPGTVQVPPATAPGPSGAPPSVPPAQTAYNPMYQQAAYPVTNGNVTSLDPQQQGMMQQPSSFTTAYAPQNYATVPSSGPVPPGAAYGSPMMSQYGEQANHAPGGYPHGGSPSHYPTNQASSQPLM